MKDFKGLLTGLGVLIFFIACIFGLQYFENYEETYYTRIDNSKVHKLENAKDQDMPYEYTLDCYDKDGKVKEFKFKTVRELREGAYLSLIVKLTGVNNWAEVTYEEMPEKVQEKYDN